MELIIEDKDGRILGTRDLEGSRWEQVVNHFTNAQDFAVGITRAGTFGEMYIKIGNGRITSDRTQSLGRLEVGASVLMAAGGLQLSWNEHHTQVWNEAAQGNKIQFSLQSAGEVHKRANEVQTLLPAQPDMTPEFHVAVRDLLASLDDLLASLNVAGAAT